MPKYFGISTARNYYEFFDAFRELSSSSKEERDTAETKINRWKNKEGFVNDLIILMCLQAILTLTRIISHSQNGRRDRNSAEK
ncbi:MAG: hypothetical protein EZS28_024690 [Streblomastix strix]|uniref:Uncharacterized protein n=1 Tax=Streblomastix strix TaxID=222440 RepID=A0A5J4VBD3_9EUKA|nr:MAG: hypothetical protein EZS28_024690 [Streblomastix strix]